ncbi:uncharacterized protein Z518_05607 [Rhinocladiella mackenziei CBS 650.93]|uniref:Uncharacterized protein n=1 Tax=Rhinocladiella mackenziei CBS 650.93 TaxID=1442369 RepID=A0A0D2FRA8_9EURO|nr:uncharacterized protein Z518_05607 [Rhinocladiella mackenziei CBS 650.93]KIX04737.1 hypothetical protein Z518_05607 [Rhinocladiella mackenziei CBS 650.93]
MAADPTVITDDNRTSILDIVATTLDIGFVSCGKDAYVWSKHDSISNSHRRAVEDVQVNGRFQIPEIVFSSSSLEGTFPFRVLAI